MSLTALLSVAGLALTACGGSSQSGESLELYGSTVEFDQELADRVPDEWKNGITIPVKVLRPNAFVDEAGENVGMQPDLVRAMGAKWGVPVTIEPVAFDGHVPGVMAGKYAFTAATGDFPERREVLDMIDYTAAGVAWLTATDSDIQDKDDICGHVIGVIKATDQEELAADKVKECDAAGIPGTKVNAFSNTLITVPLEADRIDVAYDSVSYMLDAAKNESDKFRLVGDVELITPIAMGVPAGETEKTELIRDTLQELHDEGVYGAIFEEWGLTDLALDKIYVNSEGYSLD